MNTVLRQTGYENGPSCDGPFPKERWRRSYDLPRQGKRRRETRNAAVMFRSPERKEKGIVSCDNGKGRGENGRSRYWLGRFSVPVDYSIRAECYGSITALGRSGELFV